ncbi:hypothetical protein [Luteimicrobium subarcticum]|uniref:Uncharacterized protein n=1 Tax=Luteimicrobium subarcticum TaxID=620910 RepID=A0A2M8W718_9MICO|nr:hypothetical protein [Luteimicrobium subarcticum]PJI86721.1 hypothetical protein CLV34_2641 [Luteimicrobium subarcticum]
MSRQRIYGVTSGALVIAALAAGAAGYHASVAAAARPSPAPSITAARSATEGPTSPASSSAYTDEQLRGFEALTGEEEFRHALIGVKLVAIHVMPSVGKLGFDISDPYGVQATHDAIASTGLIPADAVQVNVVNTNLVLY